MRLLSRLSLAQQVMLIVAVGLVLAQSLNFALQLRERRGFGIENAAVPAIARLVDAIDAAGQGEAPQMRGPRRLRVRAGAASPIAPGAARIAEVEALLKARIAEDAGAAVTDAQAALQRTPRGGTVLVVAVRLPDGTWLSARARGPAPLGPAIAELGLQTLVILAVLLVALLLPIRSATRPLAMLTREANSWEADRWDAARPSSARTVAGPRDVRALVTAMDEMKRRIVRMLRERDIMLGAIGHDLRTPLAALRIQVELVGDEMVRHGMIDAIDRLSGDLEAILSLARNAASIVREPTDLATIAGEVAADFRARGSEITVTQARALLAPVDAAAVRRALSNLVDNAIRYGGTVRIGLRAGERVATIVVEDDGPGIPEDALQSAMEPFVRLEPSRNRTTGGHGLGLAIVSAIARAHGGELRLANRREGGLRVEMDLALA